MLDPVEKSDFYPVRAMTPVTLSIKIGNGQVGGTNVTFDGTPLGSGPITNLPIGTAGQDLKDKSVDAQRRCAGSGLHLQRRDAEPDR